MALLFSNSMDAVALTRQLVDIESITGNEGRMADCLHDELTKLGFESTKIQIDGARQNVFAHPPGFPKPELVFSTHLDTVPPFIASSEDATHIYGRGACDAKGIIAAQVAAAVRLREENINTGMLFVVGEERDSSGAKAANKNPCGSKFLINGEPTENCVALASKGALRVDVIARGRMAHSAYPELGESAIEKLLDALTRLRTMKLPYEEGIGPSTLNIGMIEGGRATNVIPDYARAQLLYRLVGPADALRRDIEKAAGGFAEVSFPLEIPFMRFRKFDGLPTMTAAFTTDIPWLSNWGEPVLFGPGSIHVAHTDGECLEKKQLHDAIDVYCLLARKLLGGR